MARAKKYKLKINEDTWTYSSIKQHKFGTLYGASCAAITDSANKHIEFSDDEINMSTIIHEVSHAYFGYLRLDSAVNHLDLGAIEEIACEFIGEDWGKILEKAFIIYSNLANEEYNKKGYCKIHQALLDLNKD